MSQACRYLLLLAIPLLVEAQRLPWRVYTTDDGLPSNRVRKILRDSNGLLWFGTSRGLARFDGHTFTPYGPEHGLENDYVNDSVETKAGNLWIAYNKGLYVLPLQSGGTNPKARHVPVGSNNPAERLSLDRARSRAHSRPDPERLWAKLRSCAAQNARRGK